MSEHEDAASEVCVCGLTFDIHEHFRPIRCGACDGQGWLEKFVGDGPGGPGAHLESVRCDRCGGCGYLPEGGEMIQRVQAGDVVRRPFRRDAQTAELIRALTDTVEALKALVDWQGVDHQAVAAGPDGDLEVCPGDDTCVCSIAKKVNAAIRNADVLLARLEATAPEPRT